MKKYLALILAFCMVLSFAACGEKKEEKNEEQQSAEYVYPDMKIVFAGAGSDPEVVTEYNAQGFATAYFKKLIEEKSDGHITIDVFWDKVLGSDPAGTVLDGDADMGYYSVVSAYVPMASCFNLPGLLTDIDMAWDLMGNGGEMFKLYAAECEKSGLHLLAGSCGTFRQVFNNVREIRRPEDCKGLNMRVYNDDTVQTFWSHVANAVTVPGSEIYTAMQTKSIDGFEFPTYSFVKESKQEVTKYHSVFNWQWNYNPFFFVSTDTWDSWDPEVQQLFTECCEETAEYHYGIQKEDLKKAEDRIKELGVIQTILTKEDLEAWEEVNSYTRETVGKKIGGDAPELIKKLEKISADYKASH